MPIKMTKKPISSPMTTTDTCVLAKARVEFTIKQSASSSAFLHVMLNEENLLIRMETSRSLFFGFARNFSWETVGIIVSSNLLTSLDICFPGLLVRSAHLVPPIVSFSGYPSKSTRTVNLYFVRTYVT
ncbi:hypothetical protein AVEN_225150-1 [Araneus ventricosus]|uniref:Uncharacterized protein n=1 Tax=Araneus ventricosus TaxID=182803 RepID=A0A4Y2FQY9_ARAVE|nr:hypothetical protein AVEN_225150-1 [Araneus ventricosus]